MLVNWVIVLVIIGYLIAFVSMAGPIYQASRESFRDGALMLILAVTLGTFFVPLSIMGLILMAWESVTGKEI
jgi:hypothetical protein